MVEPKTWQEALEMVNYMLSQKDYNFAEITLSGIHKTISKNENVSPSQIKAIMNIYKSKV